MGARPEVIQNLFGLVHVAAKDCHIGPTSDQGAGHLSPQDSRTPRDDNRFPTEIVKTGQLS